MSFFRVPKDKLIDFLDETDSGVDTTQNKPEILKEVEKKEIEFSEYSKWSKKKESSRQSKPEPQEEQQPDYVKQDKTLVRMTAKYTNFTIKGTRFTQTHPFVVMSTEDASFLVDNRDGFEYATKEDAKEYYGDK